MFDLRFVVALAINQVFATVDSVLVKQWALTRSPLLLAAALAASIICFLSLAWVIRYVGLGLGSSLALISTILINTFIGIVFFHETLSLMQYGGIALGVIAISLIVFG